MSQQLTLSQKKEWAKQLFLQDDLSQKDIAQMVTISQQTLSKWVNVERWEDLRRSIIVSKSELLSGYYNQLYEIKKQREQRKELMTSKEADAELKIASLIRTLETETNVADKMDVGKQFLDFVRKTDGFERSKEIAHMYNAFIKSCL